MARHYGRGIPKHAAIELATILDLVGLVLIFVGVYFSLFINTAGYLAANDYNYAGWAFVVIGILLVVGDSIFLAEEASGKKFRFIRGK